MKLNQRMPIQSGFANSNNRMYNNNNNLNGQNRINMINNNFEYQNQNQNQNQKMPSISNMNNINTINNNTNSININTNIINNINSKPKCTCSKTGCRKKYCACFSKGRLCEGCECKNCQNCIPTGEGGAAPPRIDLQKNMNESENEDEYNNENGIQSPKTQRAMCNCTKSNCMKKYCECFKQGFSCNSLCRCMDCKNKIKEEVNNIINNEVKNNNIPEFHDFSGSFFPNNENENENIYESNKIDFRLPCNYQTEAFGINVRKDQLKLDKREIDLNDIPLINYGNNNELNATPKFSKRKRMRSKNESGNLKTCPTTNSSNKKGRGLSASVNKNIQKKKLNLN